MARSRKCSIPDCGKPDEKRGWCGMHYRRWSRHGDPLALTRAAPGEPLRYLHEVVIPYDGTDCLPWPYARTGQGRGNIWSDGSNRPVHNLVCEIAHGPPPTPDHQAAHSCGKGHEGCVAPRHLRWATCAENHADMVIHGTRYRGEQKPFVKLTNADVMAIKALRGRISAYALAERFGVSQSCIQNIYLGKSWTHLGR